jgi:hypothetical protein
MLSAVEHAAVDEGQNVGRKPPSSAPEGHRAPGTQNTPASSLALQRVWNAVRAEAARISRVQGIGCSGAVGRGPGPRTIAAKANEAHAVLVMLGAHGRPLGDRLYLDPPPWASPGELPVRCPWQRGTRGQLLRRLVAERLAARFGGRLRLR